MAQIPPLRRLSAEDFTKQADWIDKLLAPLNDYMERTTSALRSLKIKDNFAGDLVEVETSGTYPIKLAWTKTDRPKAVLVGNVFRSDGTTVTFTNAIGVQWSFNQSGQLQIDNVMGISPAPSATIKYKLTLVCLAG